LYDDYNTKTDMWALGVTILELYTVKNKLPPYPEYVMFPGTSCFPMTPLIEQTEEE